jgi:hypothetical protein
VDVVAMKILKQRGGTERRTKQKRERRFSSGKKEKEAGECAVEIHRRLKLLLQATRTTFRVPVAPAFVRASFFRAVKKTSVGQQGLVEQNSL